MKSPWLQRYSVLVAVVALASIISGTVVTTNEERPLYSIGEIHLPVGVFLGALMAGLVVWLSQVEKRAWLRRLGWIALVATVIEGALGLPPAPVLPAVRFAHALLAQLLFAATVAIAVCTSSGWAGIRPLAAGRPSLRTLAKITSLAALMQATLGVAFRHGITGLMPHVLGALVFAIFVLVWSMSVIYRPEHEPLSPAGVALLIITVVQVFVGIILWSMSSITDIDPVVVIVVTMVHATTAALTLAATVVMALLVWQSVPAVRNR